MCARIAIAALLATALSCGPAENTRPPSPLSVPAGSRLLGVFEGRVPCEGCERIDVFLALFVSEQNDAPTTYLLSMAYVGTEAARQEKLGRWSRQTLDTSEVVYQLGAPSPPGLAQYLVIDEEVLLVLDEELNLRVGDGAHAFALSRTR
jgi:hypothetical protein